MAFSVLLIVICRWLAIYYVRNIIIVIVFISFFYFVVAKYLRDYIFLTVGRVGGATSDITQSVVEVGEYEKREKLVEILKTQGGHENWKCIANYNNFGIINYGRTACECFLDFSLASDRTLVFVETKRNADFLASFLSQEGFPTTSIHG